MGLTEEQRDLLAANAARDRAEQLLAEMQKAAADAAVKAKDRQDLTEEQKELGRAAMEQAIAATQRMIENLNAAMALAQDAVDAGGWNALDDRRQPGEGDGAVG